jgi:hypothetical protein
MCIILAQSVYTCVLINPTATVSIYACFYACSKRLSLCVSHSVDVSQYACFYAYSKHLSLYVSHSFVVSQYACFDSYSKRLSLYVSHSFVVSLHAAGLLFSLYTHVRMHIEAHSYTLCTHACMHTQKKHTHKHAYTQVRNYPPFVGCLDYIFLSQGCTASDLRPLPKHVPDMRTLQATEETTGPVQTNTGSPASNVAASPDGSLFTDDPTREPSDDDTPIFIDKTPQKNSDYQASWFGPFPNAENPSDHLMVAATVTLRD